jgi:hypothetical protein
MKLAVPCRCGVQCRCGQVRGTLDVTPTGGVRVVCSCVDCQRYLQLLGRAELLDANGGTDLWQTTPRSLRLTHGADQLRCGQLSAAGMYRWYTACCHTPIGNTKPTGRLPFVGAFLALVDDDTKRTHAALLGEPARIQTQDATGADPPKAMPFGETLRYAWRLARLLGTGLVTGAHKPSPLFHDDGAPRATPHVLTPRAASTSDAA